MSDNTNFSHLKIPTHLAIIADGNRRWAKENGLPTLEGHKKGVENFEALLIKARELGIKYFTGWIFSTENWKRSEEENKYLFNLVRVFAKRYKERFLKEETRFIHLGRKDRIPTDVLEILTDFEKQTAKYSDFTVCVAMDYGGRDDIIRAINKLVEKNEKITEDTIGKALDTGNMIPDPDFIIRTSGEKRLSGFMSWQSAYSELYFPKTYFPAFGPDNLVKAIEEYTKRDRRFGGNSEKSKGDYPKKK